MNTRYLFWIWAYLIGVVLISNQPVDAAGSDIKLLRTGQFHGNEVDAKSGEIWYGLFKEDENYHLRKTTILVERVHDAIVDREGEMTGKKVSVDDAAEPLFLFQGLEYAKDRDVPTVFGGNEFIFPAQVKSYKYDNKYYRIAASGNVSYYKTMVIPEINDYEIFLQYKDTRQTLVQHTTVVLEGEPRLIWVGDLDNDGMLDFILKVSNHYNVRHHVLFLSSKAGEGEVVGKAAEFRTVGC